MSYPTALVAQVQALAAEGLSRQGIANALGMTRSKVRRILDAKPLSATQRNEALEALTGVRRDTTTGDKREVEAVTLSLVTTVDEAAAAAGIDLSAWTVASFETRHYPVQTADGVTQGTYIKLRCERAEALPLAAQVDALLDGVLAARHSPAPPTPVRAVAMTGRLGLLTIADPHFGKLCWSGSTGDANWNLRIAYDTVVGASTHLLQRLPPCERIVVSLLGDIFHYDTLAGTTTGGTTMDRDSRVAKMLEYGAEAIVRVIRDAAHLAPVTVIGVPGNHDAVLSLALQRILHAEFRVDPRVTVDDSYRRRKVFLWGKTLLQFDHGDKAKKKLPFMLPQEYPVEWGQSTYREIHTGHLHTAQERVVALADRDVALTEQGVLVRTHEALCPSDQWHTDEGYIGSGRSQQAFVYHVAGALEQVIRFDPRIHRLEAA